MVLAAAGYRLMLDCGIRTEVRAEYYPAIGTAALAGLDAMIITHAHEDHIGAVGWAIANGFRGTLMMTAVTRRDASSIWNDYATREEARRAEAYPVTLLEAGGSFALGPFSVLTGRSGHVAGGVWCKVRNGMSSLLYCGDAVPASPVFPMDPPPTAETVLIDASYGADDIPARIRADAIVGEVTKHSTVILPTPQMGRSLELLALIERPLALAPGMRQSLRQQIDDGSWIASPSRPLLVDRIAAATDWSPDAPWPGRPILCHDGMGMGGPAAVIIPRAAAEGVPILFTGHVPEESPGKAVLDCGRAQWLRFPTHPTLSENAALVAACRPHRVIGHSCGPDALAAMATVIPLLDPRLRTGDELEL